MAVCFPKQEEREHNSSKHVTLATQFVRVGLMMFANKGCARARAALSLTVRSRKINPKTSVGKLKAGWEAPPLGMLEAFLDIIQCLYF